MFHHLVTDLWSKILPVNEYLFQTQDSEQSKVHLMNNNIQHSSFHVCHPNPIQCDIAIVLYMRQCATGHWPISAPYVLCNLCNLHPT